MTEEEIEQEIDRLQSECKRGHFTSEPMPRMLLVMRELLKQIHHNKDHWHGTEGRSGYDA